MAIAQWLDELALLIDRIRGKAEIRNPFMQDVASLTKAIYRFEDAIHDTRHELLLADYERVDEGEIDTTPTLVRPPDGLVEIAKRDIPGAMSQAPKSDDGDVEVPASHLASTLENMGHIWAAALGRFMIW